MDRYQLFYNDDGTSYCTDINECNTPDNVCSRDAVCVNAEGTFTCTCKPGFFGNGQHCESKKILESNPSVYTSF